MRKNPAREGGIFSIKNEELKIPCHKARDFFGAGERTRTPDLLITNQLLYQLSYTSGLLLHYTISPLKSQEKRAVDFTYFIASSTPVSTSPMLSRKTRVARVS